MVINADESAWRVFSDYGGTYSTNLDEYFAHILKQHKVRGLVYKMFMDYADGRHQLMLASDLFKTRFGPSLATGKDGSLRCNLCPAVIAGFTEAIAIESWGSEENDKLAEACRLAQLESTINTASFRDGNGFVLVWPDSDGNLAPRQLDAKDIVPVVDEESPYSPIKEVWHFGETADSSLTEISGIIDMPLVDLYTTTSRARFRRDGSFLEVVDVVEYSSVGLPDEMPVFWFRLDAESQFKHGRSILTDVIPVQDLANKSLSNVMVTGERYAVPLVYLLQFEDGQTKAYTNPYASDGTINLTEPGQEPCDDPSVTPSGPPVSVVGPAYEFQNGVDDRRSTEKGGFDPDKQQVFATSAKGPMGYIPPPQLDHLLAVVKELAALIASIVGLPQYFFSGELKDVPSGDSLRQLQARRLSKVRKWHVENEYEWKRLAILLGIKDPKIVWKPATYQSETEKFTIALNMMTLGYPLEEIFKYLGVLDPEAMAKKAKAEMAARQRINDGTRRMNDDAPIVDNISAIQGANMNIDRGL